MIESQAHAVLHVNEQGAARAPVVIETPSGPKEAMHFGPPSRPLFGFYHPPRKGSWRETGVVLCNPIGADYTRSDRTYRHLAERLAGAGFAVLRFDLSFTGDSGGGDFSAGLWRAWVEDVRVAADEVRRRSGARALSLVGLRLGATLAEQSAVSMGGVDTLVLWSPCVSGKAFVAEVTKLHKLYARIEPQMAGAPPPAEDGEEALGCFFPRAVVGELSELDMLASSSCPARRALFVTGGSTPAEQNLIARLRDRGVSPDVQTHAGHKFLITVSHRSVVPDEPIDAVVSWLAGEHSALRDSYSPLPAATDLSPSGERPVRFGRKHPLFGIFTPADPTRAGGRPPIVLSNAGCVNRVGPHRIYVRLARLCASLGFDVLRVDLSGIGDSPAAPGQPENLTYPKSGLDDLREAMGLTDDRPAVVAGLCSGGDYAFQLAALGEAVAGAWLLNPRTFCVLDLARVESGSPPTSPVDEVPKNLQRMAERGVETLLLVSKNDPGVAYVDAHAGPGMQNLEGIPHFARVDVEGTDHSFTPFAVQKLVVERLGAELARFAPLSIQVPPIR